MKQEFTFKEAIAYIKEVIMIRNPKNLENVQENKMFIFKTDKILSLKELTEQIKLEYVKFIFLQPGMTISKAARLLKMKTRSSLYRILKPEKYKKMSHSDWFPYTFRSV